MLGLGGSPASPHLQPQLLKINITQSSTSSFLRCITNYSLFSYSAFVQVNISDTCPSVCYFYVPKGRVSYDLGVWILKFIRWHHPGPAIYELFNIGKVV